MNGAMSGCFWITYRNKQKHYGAGILLRRIRKRRKTMRTQQNPYMTGDFFTMICKQIEFPKIVETSVPDAKSRLITRADGVFYSRIDQNWAGDSIRLDVWLEYPAPKNRAVRLGTFLTRDRGPHAMRDMARLMADFMYTAGRFIKTHPEDFQWEGYRVSGIAEDGTSSGTVYCDRVCTAMPQVVKLLKTNPYVQFFDYKEQEACYFRMGTNGMLSEYGTLEACQKAAQDAIRESEAKNPAESPEEECRPEAEETAKEEKGDSEK